MNEMLDSRDIKENELEKLKADAIGGTVYSGKWIAEILLRMSKVSEDGWNQELESELCTLWDMTTEKEIVKYLVENDFLKVAEHCLKSTEELRFTEIIVGIIGNLSCDPEVLEILATRDELCGLIFRLLSSDDSRILLQIIRFLRGCLWDIQNNPSSVWRSTLKDSTFLREVVPFILKSSTSEDLIISTTAFLRSALEITVSTSSNFLDELFDPCSLLPGFLESFDEILPQDDCQYSSSTRKYLEDWLELFSSILEKSILEEANLCRTIEIVRRILAEFVDPYNLFPLEETRATCIHRATEIVLRLRVKEMVEEEQNVAINRVIVGIMFRIVSALNDGESDPEDTMKELLKYLEGYWIEISRISTVEEISRTLKISDQEILEYCISLLKSTKKIPSEKVEDIVQRLRVFLSNNAENL